MKKLITATIVIILLASCSRKMVTTTEQSGMQYCDTVFYKTVGGNQSLADRRAQVRLYKLLGLPVPVKPKTSLWKRTYSVTRN